MIKGNVKKYKKWFIVALFLLEIILCKILDNRVLSLLMQFSINNIIIIIWLKYREQASIFKNKDKIFRNIIIILFTLCITKMWGTIYNTFFVNEMSAYDSYAYYQTTYFLRSSSVFMQATYFICGSLTAPIVEEIIFRDVFDSSKSMANTVIRMVISSFLFAIIHSSSYIYYFVIGLLLCTAYILSKTMKVPMIAHIINNFIAMQSFF